MSRAETLSDRRIQWGILTNGRLWRLYYQGANSRPEQYLEIDLSRLVDVPASSDLLTERDEAMREHWLRVFALMFGRASFVEQTPTAAPSIFSLSTRAGTGKSGSRGTCPIWCSENSFPISSRAGCGRPASPRAAHQRIFAS